MRQITYSTTLGMGLQPPHHQIKVRKNPVANIHFLSEESRINIPVTLKICANQEKNTFVRSVEYPMRIIWVIFNHRLSVRFSATYYLLDLLPHIICWIFCHGLPEGPSAADYLFDLWLLIICLIFSNRLFVGSAATYVDDLCPLFWRIGCPLPGGSETWYLEDLTPIIGQIWCPLSGGSDAHYLEDLLLSTCHISALIHLIWKHLHK